MSVFYSDGQATLHQGDVRDVLRSLPAESVHSCCTSPPYYGLRAYGTAPQTWGGRDDCAHEWGESLVGNRRHAAHEKDDHACGRAVKRDVPIMGAFCIHCGAWSGELGSEPTVQLFVEHLVDVFREVRRALRSDGTLWINLGDSYDSGTSAKRRPSQTAEHGYWTNPEITHRVTAGLKPKDLMMVPARVALALQDDGWYLRSVIVWSKTSCMPESVTDRPTTGHEYIYLLAKAETYFYDSEAVKEPQTGNAHSSGNGLRPKSVVPGLGIKANADFHAATSAPVDLPNGRNLRTVWTLGPEPSSVQHYATFPTAIPRRAILAGTSEHGCCARCGAPWRRVVERSADPRAAKIAAPLARGRVLARGGAISGGTERSSLGATHLVTRLHGGWCPSCRCDAPIVPAVVLDPFVGSGTTCAVAKELGRYSIGIDLSEKYIHLAADRCRQLGLMPQREEQSDAL